MPVHSRANPPQVWFQNRRQNDRRKSRPLTSEELANLHHSGIRLVSAAKDPADHESVLKVTSGPVPIAVPDPIRRPGMPMSVSFDGRYQPQHHHQHGHSRSLSSEEANHHAALPHQQPFPPSSQDSTHPGLSSSFPGTLGYIANRRRESGAHAFSTPASRPAHHLDSSFTFRYTPILLPYLLIMSNNLQLVTHRPSLALLHPPVADAAVVLH